MVVRQITSLASAYDAHWWRASGLFLTWKLVIVKFVAPFPVGMVPTNISVAAAVGTSASAKCADCQTLVVDFGTALPPENEIRKYRSMRCRPILTSVCKQKSGICTRPLIFLAFPNRLGHHTQNQFSMSPQGPYKLVTVNTAPERAKRLVGRVVEAVKEQYTIQHVANCES